MGYILCEGVSYCRVLDSYIFLDLRRDRYFCLGTEAACAFGALLSGSETDPVALADLMIDGVLKRTDGSELPRHQTAIVAHGSLLHAGMPTDPDPGSGPDPGGVAEALSRRLAAELTLGMRGLRGCVAKARRISERALPPPDMAQASSASAAFAASSLWRSRMARCVSISLATLGWFAARDCSATMVVGVKLHPFEAHCWVQVGDLLINDEVDKVRPFVPILSV